jgi:hypothetical protein
MTEQPLYIDTDAVRAGGNEMLTALEGLQPAPPTTALTGSDPLSMAIIGQVPSIQAPIVFGLPVIKEDATKTATGIKDAADRYEKADEMLGQRIEEQAAQLPGGPGAPGAGGVPGAGGAGAAQNAAASQGGAMGQMGQMMGMPMQMAQQAAQLPMQAMGMAAALPQAVMQGVQQAVQQVGQLGGSGDQKAESVDEALRAEPAVEKPERDEEERGAEPGQPGTERAPETGGSGEPPSEEAPPVPPRTPAPTRPAESDGGINL